MDANDFAFIESRLEVVLPTLFKEFMSRFANDRRYGLESSCGSLDCNAELFALFQLGLFNNDHGFDYYELQPELRSRRFMVVADDGCGNHFCMPGDDRDTAELWMWEHDPPNGFGIWDGWTLREFFGDNWELVSRPDPFATTTGVFVLRADHPDRSPFHPISMQEWLAYVDSQPNLSLDENHEGRNPFNGEAMVFRRWPGRAQWTVAGRSHHVSYFQGRLCVRSDDFAKSELEQIAADLNAHIWQEPGD